MTLRVRYPSIRVIAVGDNDIVVAFGSGAGFGLWYYVGIAVAAAILAYEHQLVKPGDLSRLDAAFFTMNGVMSVTVFGFALVDRLMG